MNLLNKSKFVRTALLIGVLGLGSVTLHALDTSQQERIKNDRLNSSSIIENAPASQSTPNTLRADQMGNAIAER